jgi:predicted ATPase
MAPQKFIENVCSVPVNHSFVFSKSVIPTRTRKEKVIPKGMAFFFSRLAKQALSDLRVMSTSSVARWVTSPSAASGR